MIFTPWVVSVLAPGLVDDPARFDLAVALTRITFPYLALVSIETLFAGILNANNRFAAAAGAPILLNLSIVTTLLLTPFFADAGHAAAWGVLAAGIVIVLVVGGDAEAHGYRHQTADAAAQRADPPIPESAWPRDHRRGRRAACAFRRHADRLVPPDRRAVGALLRRSHQPASHRRGRHRRRHRSPARDVAPAWPPATRRARPRPKPAASSSRCCSPFLAPSPPSSSPISSCARCLPAALSPSPMPRRPARRSPPIRSGFSPSCCCGVSPRRSMRAAIPPPRSRRRCSPPPSTLLLKVVLMGPSRAGGPGAGDERRRLDQFQPAGAVSPRRQGFAVSGAAIGKPVMKLLIAGVVLAAVLFVGAYGLERALAGMAHFREETVLALLLALGDRGLWLGGVLLLGRPVAQRACCAR